MHRDLGCIFFVVMVVLAGCNGLIPGSDEPTETVTPAPVPTDKPTPTPVPQFAPGITGKGIEDASALLAAHTSVLENRSFTIRTNTAMIAPNGSVVINYTDTLWAGPPGTGVYSRSERNGSLGYPEARALVREMWSNNTIEVINETYANGTTTYDRLQYDHLRQSAAGEFLQYALGSLGTATTSVTKRERNGTTRYLVRGRTRTGEGVGTENRSLRMLVDSRGVVHELRVVRTPLSENISRVVSETRFSAIGSTDAPERPSWVDDALHNTTPISKSMPYAQPTTTRNENMATRTNTATIETDSSS